ncbi:hypothetical protein Pelo_12542 [Pelomyxa schiedti]|nr:hypothetical protein Pelo_12542 [Pelomyxa schiedti]
MMGGSCWVVELGSMPIKEKKGLVDAIKSIGGTINVLVKKDETTHVITTADIMKLPNIKLRTALSLGVHIVTPDFVWDTLSFTSHKQGRRPCEWNYRLLGEKPATSYGPSQSDVVLGSFRAGGRAAWGLAYLAYYSVPLTSLAKGLQNLGNLCRGMMPRTAIVNPDRVCAPLRDLVAEVTNMPAIPKSGSRQFSSTSRLGLMAEERERKKLERQLRLNAERVDHFRQSSAKRTVNQIVEMKKKKAAQIAAQLKVRQQLLEQRKKALNERRKALAEVRRKMVEDHEKQRATMKERHAETRETILKNCEAMAAASQQRISFVEDLRGNRDIDLEEAAERARIQEEEEALLREQEKLHKAKIRHERVVAELERKLKEKKRIKELRRKAFIERQQRERAQQKLAEERDKARRKAMYEEKLAKEMERKKKGIPPPPIPSPPVNTRKVFLGNVSFADAGTVLKRPQDLQTYKQRRISNMMKIMESFGKITQCNSFWDKGHAFVTYAEPEAAEKCISVLGKLDERKRRIHSLRVEITAAEFQGAKKVENYQQLVNLMLPHPTFYVASAKDNTKSKKDAQQVESVRHRRIEAAKYSTPLSCPTPAPWADITRKHRAVKLNTVVQHEYIGRKSDKHVSKN